jgi:AcrR family transcriptional regulator
MPRPSQNVDQLLLDAGLELLPQTGCAGLSVRKLADHAGVNLGMFHYHFKNKDTFVRAVLQRVYEEMFSALTLKVDPKRPVLDNLRAVVAALARFGREQQALLLRMAADAMAGEAAVIEFFATNLPRHVAVVTGLVVQAQREGHIAKAPPPEVVAFLFGAVGAPMLIGGAARARGPEAVAGLIDRHVLPDAAVERRIDWALRGLSA